MSQVVIRLGLGSAPAGGAAPIGPPTPPERGGPVPAANLRLDHTGGAVECDVRDPASAYALVMGWIADGPGGPGARRRALGRVAVALRARTDDIRSTY